MSILMGSGRTKPKKELQIKQADQPAPKRKKWQRIQWTSVESAYITREDSPSYDDLEAEFHLGKKAIDRYAVENHWVTKRKLFQDKLRIKISENVGKKIAEVRAKNIMVAEGTLSYLMELLKAKQLKGTVSDIDKMIRAIEFLYGNADSRPDSGDGGFEAFLRKLNAERRKAYKDAMGGNNLIDIPVIEVTQDDISKRPDSPDNE